MATVDELLGPEPQKSADDILGPPPAPPPPVVGTPEFDAWYAQTPYGRINDAFRQGAKDGWGAEPLGIAPDTEDFLKKAGIFDDYANGQKNLVKQFNEAIIRPAVLLGQTAFRALNAGFGAFQSSVSRIGQETRGTQAGDVLDLPGLADTVASLPEAFMGSPHPTGIPRPAEVPKVDLAKARDLGVIGEGEAGYAGTAERKPLDPDLAAQALRSEEPASKPAEADVTTAAPEPSTPAPDIHDVARQIAPDVFSEYDDLSTRRDTFGRWMQELRDGAREKAAAPFEAEITDLTARLEDATPRLAKKYQARLDDLTTQRDAAVADALRADNPDMARVRQAYQEADFRMRDLAPDVSAAYRDAEARIGPTEEPVAEPVPAVRPSEGQAPAAETPTEAPVAEGEPSVSPAAPGTAEPQLTVDEGTAKSAEPAPAKPAPEAATAATDQPNSQPKYVAEIANDVTKKLTAAGRPEEEARAAAQVIASYYETRAARFNGERGTAADLYNAEAPEIRSGEPKVRAKELAQKNGAKELEQSAAPETPEFKRWFGKSKVVDADGKPLAVYHGTIGDIENFDQEKSASATGSNSAKLGFFFTDSPRVAGSYAEHAAVNAPIHTLLRDAEEAEKRGDWDTYDAKIAEMERLDSSFGDPQNRLRGQNIVPVYVSIRNPLVIDAKGETFAASETHITDAIKRAKASGHDGVIIRNLDDAAGLTNVVADHYVAFKPSQIKSVHNRGTFDPNSAKIFEQAKRGKIRIAPNGQKIITLFKDADASTFLHESGHQFLEDLLADAEHPLAPSDLKADAQTVRDWLGAKDGESIKTRQHEKFARGFERYMMEGVAPSKALARVFAQFRDWLTRIYQTVKNLKAPINDDIRSVFDRMLSQKPERTVIAPERKGSFADIHEADAENTPPERAHPVAETIQAERDTIAPDILTPEEENARLADTPDEARSREAGSAEPHRDEPQAEPLAGENGAAQGVGAVGAGGGEAQANRAGPRGKPTEPPAGPNARFPDPESRLVDKAGNIRLDNLGTPEDINAALRQTAEENDDFRGARRNVVSDQEVLDFADAMGVDARQINLEKLREMSLKDGIPLAARIVSGRKMLIQSATEVRDLMARAADGSDADVLAYARAKERHLMIQETVSAITAEIGRAMRAFRKLGGDQGVADLGKFLKDNTGKTLFQLRQEAKLGKSLDTPQKVSKYLTDSVKPTFGNMILEYWINGLISGPATHTTYMIGNALLGLWRAVPETAAAALIGKARGLLGDEGPRVHAGEVAAQLKAAVTELPSALSAAGQSLKTGVTTLLPEEKPRALPLQPGTELVTPGKIANAHMTWRQLGADAFGTMRGVRDGFVAAADLVKNGGVEEAPFIGLQRSNLGSIPDIQVKGITALPVGTVIRLPGRAIAAIHSFFRTTNYSMAKAAEAYRGAAEEGLSGEQFKARVGELVTNPSEQMMERSRAVATDLTLMGQGGEFVRALTAMTNHPVNLPLLGNIRPLKFIDPFVHIGANIIDQAIIQRGPLGIFSEQIRNDLLGKNGRVAQDEAGARMLVGTALSITAGTLAMQGLVTPSGPTDPHEAAIWRLAGNQAHSVRVGDFLYDVHRLGPLGMQIGIAADLYDVIHAIGNEDASKIAGMLVHSISQNILDESFMRGPSDLLKALEESDRYGASYVRNFLSSFLPYSVGMAQIARAIDPYTRQTRSVMDSFLAKIPGESQTLLPRRDIFGEPMPSREVLGVPGFSAIYVSKINNDPVIRAFQDTHYFPGQPGRAIRGVELTDQQYDDYSRIAGRLAKVRLDAIVRGPGFSAMPANIQHDLIVSTVEHAREAARTTIMIQNPTIMQAAMDAKTEPLRTGELRPKGPVKQKEAQ